MLCSIEEYIAVFFCWEDISTAGLKFNGNTNNNRIPVNIVLHRVQCLKLLKYR